jgi:hypothetical protein
LKPGKNVIGSTVLFYGAGDGTWPLGKPGFLFWLELTHADGRVEQLVSDADWQVSVCRAWQPGHYKRWYLRALQEEFDARQYPYGWQQAQFTPGPEWLPAMVLHGSPNQPALSAGYYEYMLDIGGGPPEAQLRPREIPMLQEVEVPVWQLSEAWKLRWKTSPKDYFDFRTPDAFTPQLWEAPAEATPGTWEFELDPEHGLAVTFEWKEQGVGWPYFTVEAPEGTVIELLVHEAHRKGLGAAAGELALLNTHFDSWTRFICRAGVNRFETFDFESFRWAQLHFHPGCGKVRLSNIGLRRRLFPWPNQAVVQVGDAAVQRLFDACVNTLNNSAQETLVDGMARERQQYSGDGGHQMHAVHLAFGERRLVGRYIKTWSQGLTKDGFFLDCWPAYDRLARLIERQLDLSGWGPILDHGVGFNLDCFAHYMYTGSLAEVGEAFPRLLRFAGYLRNLVGPDGLLPVDDLGIPSVWIDHIAYQRQRHKQCAFNLYAAAAMKHALAPLCRAFGHSDRAQAVEGLGETLHQAVIRAFWDSSRRLFVDNLPWLDEEKQIRLCDRSLATSILFEQCPDGDTQAAVEALAECPPEMGFSYPCNAGWRLWALAKAGRADVITSDFRTRWATMTSVLENNTLQEDWEARHDSGQQWSHCAVIPLFLAYHGLMGLRPLEAGFARLEVRPQLGDLEHLDLTAFTVPGPVVMRSRGKFGARRVTFQTPAGVQSELVLPRAEQVPLPVVAREDGAKVKRYKLPGGQAVTLELKHC